MRRYSSVKRRRMNARKERLNSKECFGLSAVPGKQMAVARKTRRRMKTDEERDGGMENLMSGTEIETLDGVVLFLQHGEDNDE